MADGYIGFLSHPGQPLAAVDNLKAAIPHKKLGTKFTK